MPPFRKLALGFALIILLGALLLSLPFAIREGVSFSFVDALFTSTSATCVTGLIVADTYTTFTLFGQIVLIVLIQIGGLGFMTFAALFSIFLGRRIGLSERSMLMESVSAPKIGGIVAMIRRVAVIAFTAEAIGAVLLATRMIPRFGAARGIWFSAFHAISAFCNAGFDLMGIIEPYSSLSAFVSDPIVNFAVMLLILTGGLGFWVWDDFRLSRHHFSKYHLHTKLMLTFSLLLIVLPAVFFFFTEKDATLRSLPLSSRILASLFEAVTPRTAGFNTTDTAQMSSGGYLMTMFLMMVGGGAGSTAGGLKVTTLSLILLSLFAHIRGRENPSVFSRQPEDKRVKTAQIVFSLYLALAFSGILLLSILEPDVSLRALAFEVFSAMSTVGMSFGVTRSLSVASRLVVILLMFIGRVGLLSFVFAISAPKKPPRIRYPEEDVLL
ncbi:MAG: Trk family potassium uptake protein [Clostridia bacterium]|nr:Trk family potassium uptake protein [Clostridia bacterium]